MYVPPSDGIYLVAFLQLVLAEVSVKARMELEAWLLMPSVPQIP